MDATRPRSLASVAGLPIAVACLVALPAIRGAAAGVAVTTVVLDGLAVLRPARPYGVAAAAPPSIAS